MNLYKRGLRVLGIAESFRRSGLRSILAGVVMRVDCEIDGVAVDSANVGGLDATDAIFRIFEKLDRDDINLILLNGAVISWFNIIEIDKVFDELNLPIIAVTYETSEGLETYIKEYFGACEDFDERMRRYRGLGERCEVILKNGYNVWVRTAGISKEDATTILNRVTRHGRIPEPVKVARLIARSVMEIQRS